LEKIGNNSLSQGMTKLKKEENAKVSNLVEEMEDKT
jgi:hypothetical protein